MVLYWRRYGRVGGCQIINGGVAQLGEHLPCKQGVKSSNLSVSIADLILHKCSLKTEYRDQTILNILIKEVKTSEVTKLISLGYRNNKQL